LIYQSYALPPLNYEVVRGLTKIGELEKLQRAKRKAETDAIVPHFAHIRAEAHLRCNRIERLYQVCKEIRERIQRTGESLPVSFSYDEGADDEQGIPAQERYHFRVWDRRSFVLAHQGDYIRQTVRHAKSRQMAFREEREHLFFELVKVERLIDDAPAQGLWFEELLRHNVLGENDSGSPEEIEAKMQWLHSWGYGLEDLDAHTRPFYTNVQGLLKWPRASGAATFLVEAGRRTPGSLFLIEPLYAAALFGLLALEAFTTTGMRINEAMQIRLTKDCLVRLEMPAPPEAKDQSLRIRYALRLLPKGERTERQYEYFIGTETLRVLARVGRMLEELYGHQFGEKLAAVTYNPRHTRSHRFAPAPYLFQYNRTHLAADDITACMRFLLHGMLFRTKEGQLVVLKAHLLRHAFATHAVQIERIPLDIVGMWLKQKNLDVTAYYSEPTASMIGEAADQYLARVSSHIHVGEAVLRSPEEYQQLYEQAKGKAGTLASVIGGDCVMHGYCPAKFACVGCPGKVPDPAKRSQVESHKQWAQQQVTYALEEGLLPEAERMKQLVRECEQELRQMDQIERYRRDEKQIPIIKMESYQPS